MRDAKKHIREHGSEICLGSPAVLGGMGGNSYLGTMFALVEGVFHYRDSTLSLGQVYPDRVAMAVPALEFAANPRVLESDVNSFLEAMGEINPGFAVGKNYLVKYPEKKGS